MNTIVKESIAVIPARGGSKRIPKKNIRPFGGKPMISHSIEAALESGLFEKVIVSTDSEEIAEVAIQYGAEVPFLRPASLADDMTGTDAVFLHALEWLAAAGIPCTYACLIYATAPFLRTCDLLAGLQALRASQATSAFTVTSFPFPIFRGLTIAEDGHLAMIWPEHRMARSQDLPDAYHDAGLFYWALTEKYLVKRSLYADAVPVIVPRKFVQDIDTQEDWDCAEAMWRARGTPT